MPNGTGRIVVALALALLGSCSDGAGPDDVLTAEQSDALLAIVGDMLFESSQAEIGSGGTMSFVVPCLFKGEVDGSGKLTVSPDSSTYSVDLTMVYRKCRQGSDVGVFVLDGTVRFTSTDKSDDVAQTRAIDQKLTGALDWSLDKTSGSCEMDLTITVRATATTGNSDLTGSFCGTSFPTS